MVTQDFTEYKRLDLLLFTSFRVCFFDPPNSLEDFKIVVWG